MLVSGSTVSELPISSSKDMLNKSNDEVFSDRNVIPVGCIIKLEKIEKFI